jgi:hypothetical protein
MKFTFTNNGEEKEIEVPDDQVTESYISLELEVDDSGEVIYEDKTENDKESN